MSHTCYDNVMNRFPVHVSWGSTCWNDGGHSDPEDTEWHDIMVFRCRSGERADAWQGESCLLHYMYISLTRKWVTSLNQLVFINCASPFLQSLHFSVSITKRRRFHQSEQPKNHCLSQWDTMHRIKATQWWNTNIKCWEKRTLFSIITFNTSSFNVLTEFGLH